MPTPRGCFYRPDQDPLDRWSLLRLLLPWPWNTLL